MDKEAKGYEARIVGRVLELGTKAGRKELDAMGLLLLWSNPIRAWKEQITSVMRVSASFAATNSKPASAKTPAQNRASKTSCGGRPG